MASFFFKLFGGGSATASGPQQSEPETYEGFVLRAAPEAEGSQFRLAGVIIKETADGNLERHFVRADLFTDRDEAIDYTLRKGRQIIDEQGDRLFADGEKTGRA